MRVLVTGATGMIGSHTAAALDRAGHEVRLLVRRPERIAAALSPLGLTSLGHVKGDVTESDAVERALEGCDAVVHSAGMLSFDKARDAEMQHTNVEGTRLVLGAAHRLGLDPIVYVSSTAAVFPPDGPIMTTEDSVKEPRDLYSRSKSAAERIARAMQAEGAPVTITYPGGVFGPNDPTVHDGVALIFGLLLAGFYPTPSAGLPFVDVRDVAAAHAAAMKPGLGPRRFMVGGHFISFGELVDTFKEVTGRHVVKLPAPGPAMRLFGRLCDVARKIGIDPGGFSYEAMWVATNSVPCDNSAVERDLGVEFRPVAETIRDLLQWMHEAGLAKPEQIGRLLHERPDP